MIPGFKKQTKAEKPQTYPVLPVKDNVLFPGMALTLTIGEKRSKKLIADLKPGDKIIITALKDIKHGVADPENIYETGMIARKIRTVRERDIILLAIHGEKRVKINEYIESEPYFKATITALDETAPLENQETEDKIFQIKELGKQIIVELGLPEEAANSFETITNPGLLTDIVASNMRIEKEDKQRLLETLDIGERLDDIEELMIKELHRIGLTKDITNKVSQEMDKSQREYFLRQQLKAIKEELNEGEVDEALELEESIRSSGMPEEVEEVALKELGRLSKMPPSTAEYTVSRTYISWLIDLPWNVSTEDNEDIEGAKTILDEGHFGLKKAKKRIVEYLAVKKLKGDMGGPILCFVGPPGVGKTSIAKSVAEALGRKTARVSLGGVRDEAEIRGHRRTYVGALPGRIIQSIKKAGSNNPVIVLDEIDKLGYDYRGDPSSALLEVLDPEQNYSFSDHYLDVDFDLSKVLFITTANSLHSVPAPLKDRMEIIDFAGYTQDEKLTIAKRHLLPRQLERHGISKSQVTLDDAALSILLEEYTREAGVRSLEREIATVLRNAACKIAENKAKHVKIDRALIEEVLGPRKYYSEVKERTMNPGVSTGLAWTPAGGEILFIESNLMPGKKGLILTGQLGDVMKESAQAALSYVKSHAKELGIDEEAFTKKDIHIHVPAGAIPKDGPSAGVAITTALVSLLKNMPVPNDIAMTGEITLKGRVLPVGGIKEKALGAQRAGIDTMYLPKRNEKDLIEIPEEIKKKMHFKFAENIGDVLNDVFAGDVEN